MSDTTATPAPAAPDERASEERLAATSAAASGIPYFDTRTLKRVEKVTDIINLDTLRQYRVAPLHRYNDHSVELGLTDETDRAKLPELQASLPEIQLTFKTISPTGLNHILNQTYYNLFQTERDGDFTVFSEKLATIAPQQAFEYIAQLAFWLGASDIHIEPQAEVARIRFRIDGVLHPITTVASSSYTVFLSDLQTRAEIKWGSDEAQSGRISYTLVDANGTPAVINMRIETIPSFHGEEIVVRLFNNETQDLRLDMLGFTAAQTKQLQRITAHPNGMVLTVGPTGSGKTSTLYALLNEMNHPDIKIITLEDPVEYDLPGITQIPVHTEDADSFAAKLRAVMREDPNVIMIGEIRDLDTAKTALQAALTGHLVLSTFHATDAGAAVSRMLDLIGQNPLFASAVRLIIAQRLVRRICPHCVREEAATKEELAFISRVLATIPGSRRPALAIGTKAGLKLKHGAGCPACHGLGYQGRIAIVEMMVVTPDLEKLMMSTAKITAHELESAAVQSGMATLLEDGLSKALGGITTIAELMSLEAA